MPAIIYPHLPLAAEAAGAYSPLLQAGAERGSRSEAHPFDGIDRVVAGAGATMAGSSMPSRPTD